MMSPTS